MAEGLRAPKFLNRIQCAIIRTRGWVGRTPEAAGQALAQAPAGLARSPGCSPTKSVLRWTASGFLRLAEKRAGYGAPSLYAERELVRVEDAD